MTRRLVAVLLACGFAWSASPSAQSRKVDVCHRDGPGTYHEININRNALPAHVAHGDAEPGTAVPGMAGYEFDSDCVIVLSQPNFVTFYIRNSNLNPGGATIAPPWDSDMNITENAEGDGFSALTPRAGQKVGYGTNFLDNRPINTIESANWDKISGIANVVSYLNIWVTDGTNFAVIASENDYRGTNFLTRQEWKVFEYDTAVSLDWLCSGGRTGTRLNQYLQCNGVNATLADIPTNVVILSPNMTAPPTYIGTGAPRAGYGFNLIFGDTQANFVGSYSLENLNITVSGVTYFAVD